MGFIVALNAGLASWWGWTVFGVRAKVESERTTLQLEMDGLSPQVAYYHQLETESKQYKSREKTLASITSSRISWTRKLDELIDVANAGGDGSRHLVWLDGLTATQVTDATGKNFGSVRAGGHSGSEKFAQVANFLEDLEISAFVDDFQKPSPPEGTQTLIDETLVPPIAWSFPLALSLKSPEDRVKGSAERLRKAATSSPTDADDNDTTGSNGSSGSGSTEKKATGTGTTNPSPAPSTPSTTGATTDPSATGKTGTSTQKEPR
jgi:hypothetical protein